MVYRFNYLFLTDGSKRYNCTIKDLHDRSVIVTVIGKEITAELAKVTLQKAIDSQPGIDLTKLMLHCDQGSQLTSQEFTSYYASLGLTQSVNKAGYPYNIASMVRYFNTLKNELIYLRYYHTDKELTESIGEFDMFTITTRDYMSSTII